MATPPYGQLQGQEQAFPLVGLRLASRAQAELRATGAELLAMAQTASTADTMDALRRLSERYSRLAAERDSTAIGGDRILVSGRILDDRGRPVPDVLIEVWQAGPSGRYSHPDDRSDLPLDPGFKGHGFMRSDADGWYRFTSVKPGRYHSPQGVLRASHIHLALSGPGFANRLHTEMFIPEVRQEPSGAAPDEAGELAPPRLLASYDDGLCAPGHGAALRFDLILGHSAAATPFDDTVAHPWLAR
jgi:protocatechuate 3,4-dioxygenase, beta subunit